VSSAVTNKYFKLNGEGLIYCLIKDFNLAPGEYLVTLYLGLRTGETLDCLNHVVHITVAGGDYFGTGHPGFPEHCRVLKRSDWSISE
jgi:lipopolysaccharide transport system ATP-binding protein